MASNPTYIVDQVKLGGLTTGAVNYALTFATFNAPITSVANDTPANWAALGNLTCWYTTAGQLTDQPSQYGILFSMVASSDVSQLWFTQREGKIYRRSGNANGWATSWTEILQITSPKDARNTLGVQAVQQIQASDTKAYKLTGDGVNGFTFTLKRGWFIACICFVDYWDDVRYIGTMPSWLKIVKNTGENSVIIQEDAGTDAAFIITAIGATIEEVARDESRTNTNFTKAFIDAGQIVGTLPIENGGTGASNAADARTNLEVDKAVSYMTFSGTSLTAVSGTEYVNNTAISSLAITLPQATRGAIFGVNFTSNASFSTVTFSSTVKQVGEAVTAKNKRYNLIIWWEGSAWWCAAKSI